MTEIRPLPPPRRQGLASLEEALDRRHTRRELAPLPLDDPEVSQLLWAAQGIAAHGGRTAPSAGALYPLEVYLVTPTGCEHFIPRQHRLGKVRAGDLRPELAQAALAQGFVGLAPLTLILCAVYHRSAARYGPDRGARYTLLEAGHAAQNVLLQAAVLGLAAIPVGAFDDQAVQRLLGLPPDHEPVYLLAVGRPA